MGAFATSYIKTTTASVTRSPDIATISSLSSIGFSATQGTVFAEVAWRLGGSGSPRAFCFSDGTTNNRILVYAADSTTDTVRLFVVAGGVTQADINSGVAATNATYMKVAISWAANSFRIAVNGTGGTEVTSGTVPTVSQLDIGRELTGNYLNGWIKRLSYSPVQASQSFLNSITS